MEQVIEVLNNDGVILYPTDTIWGLGCKATSVEGIRRIFEIKSREQSKSMIILVESEKRLMDLVEVPAIAWDLMDLAEKPLTIVYDDPKGLPKELLAPDGSIAIRLTKEPYLKKLISKLNCPLVSTSANLSGEKSPLQFSDIHKDIVSSVDFVVNQDQDRVSTFSGSSIIRIWSDNRIHVIRE